MSKTIFKLGLGVAAAILLTVAGTVQAAPFNKQIHFKQPDGTQVQLHGWGDEFYAIFETQDGYTAIYDQTARAYCYARQNESGQLASLGVQVQLAAPVGLAKHERMSLAARKSQVADLRQKREDATHLDARWKARLSALAAFQATNSSTSYSPPSHTTTGVKLGLTLLVDFSDDPATIPQADFIDFCNGTNYTGYGNNGSVMQYYYDNSGGMLTYSNVVTIYIRAPKAKSYYNDVTKSTGPQAQEMINDVLDTLMALPNYTTDILPTFSGLTVDGSSQIVACNVLFAGDNSGVWAMGLWPHQSALSVARDLGNGKKVSIYEITEIGSSLDIGTFCHENGHMLCDYPDIYDYDYDSVGGAGYFCLMSYGNNFPGNPVQICAYLKRTSGWGTTVELDYTSALIANSGTTGTNFNRFYRYQKPGVPTEYYLIENRERQGRDAGLPASGLAIWHVDELGDRDNQSTNYNSSHENYELTLMQADGLWDFENTVILGYYNYGDANDLYYATNSAAGYLNAFSDTNMPSARWWDGTASGLRITEISNPSTNMTYRVGYANVVTPPNNPAIISAPQAPWGSTLAELCGDNPNGDWYLFIQDTSPQQSGVITNGWYITLTTANPIGNAADNQVFVTPTVATSVVGGTWNYTVAVTNYGPSISTNVYVSDLLPLGFNLVSRTTAVGSTSMIGSRLLAWNVGTLAVGAGATLNVKLSFAAAGVYTNTITVAADTTDLNADDDTVSSVFTVTGASNPPQLATASYAAGTGFKFHITGDAVTTKIQASTNLVNWVDLYTGTPPFDYTDSGATGYPQRFYRAITAP